MKVIKAIIKALTIMCGVLVCGMLLLVCADVFLRYVFKAPINGAIELEQMLNVTLMLALGTTVLAGNHIKVDIVADLLPKKAQKILTIITHIISLLVFALIAWQAFESCAYMIRRNIRYSSLRFPTWPFYLLIGLGFAGGVIALVHEIILLSRSRDDEGIPMDEVTMALKEEEQKEEEALKQKEGETL